MSDEHAFAVAFPDHSVQIYRDYVIFGDSTTTTDEQIFTFISVTDSEGQTIEKVSSKELIEAGKPNLGMKLSGMYDEIKVANTKSDKSIGELLHYLRKKLI